VGLVDRGTVNAFEVRGQRVEKHLQEILAADIAVPVDHSRGAFVPSTAGGIAADLTLVRTANDTFFVIGSTPEDVWHLRQETPHSEGVVVSDVTSATTALALIGPGASAVLSSVSQAALPGVGSTEAPLVDIGGVPVRVIAENETGLGGWTLFASTEHGLYLWDLLVTGGAQHGLVPVGDEAFGALRLANGVPAFGIEYGPQDNPWEAALPSRNCPVDGGPRPGHRLLVRLTLQDPRHAIIPGAPVSKDGAVVGYVTSAAEDPASGLFRAFAWVDPEAAAFGSNVAISHLRENWPARIDRTPLANA
jgi:glycine cleavage system aminomethyltransferase T